MDKLVKCKENSKKYGNSRYKLQPLPLGWERAPMEEPCWREHGHFSLDGREVTVMRHWWNLLAIFPLELAGNLFSRVPKKAVYRKVSHGNILLWNFLRSLWGNLLATETVRCYSRQELGAGEVVHTLQEADAGEAVCTPRAGHKKRETMHTTIARCGRSQMCCTGLPSELTWTWEENLFLLQSLSGTSLLPTGKAKIYVKYYIHFYRAGKEGQISKWKAFSW